MALTEILSQEKAVDSSVLFNPFPGLRPFSMDESHLFFGREGQSDEVLKKLSKYRFAAVIGTSGSGKSSLMYCGLLPILYGGFIAKAGSKWHTIVTRPGNSPIDNLANSLVESIAGPDDDEKTKEVNKKITSTILRGSSLGLIKAIKQLKRPAKENTLILVDQFEELFRFKKGRKDSNSDNESQAFVKMLVEAINQSEVPIYIVLTMRSDFIGDCAQFPDLTMKINNSHYLIPQMTREDLKDAIVGPVAVGGGAITNRLTEELLNGVGDNPDQLPILQHSLMRTWEYWVNHRVGDEKMGVKHYEAIGEMGNALSLHANEAYDELSVVEKEQCEHIFRTLTEKGADNRGIRHPSSIKELVAITGTSEEEVINIVNRFRKTGRSFLTPSSSLELHSDSVVDISHESLMRVWDRLTYWVEEEAQSIQMYLRLSEAAHMYQLGKTNLWRPPDLQLAVNWKEKQKPNLAWAERYHPAFERSIVFLDTSAKQYEAEEQNKIRQQKRAIRRNRLLALIFGFFTLVSMGLLMWAVQQRNAAEKQKEIAINAKNEADRLRIEAVQSAEEAERQKLLALENAREADKQRQIAEVEKTNAEQAKLIAERSAKEAERQKAMALNNLLEAKRQKERAQKALEQAEKSEAKAVANAEEAEKQRALAEQSTEDALNLRMLSIAQSMAVKSQQMVGDTNRKALLAYQAYSFHTEYGGKAHNTDVYNGLYYALKTMKEEEYNSLKGHEQSVRSMVFANNGGQLYTADADGKVFSWNGNEGIPTELVDTKQTNRKIALSSNDQTMAIATDRSDVKIVQTATGDISSLEGHTGKVWDIAFSDDNTIISSSADTTIRFWDAASGTELNKITEASRVRSIDVSDDKNWLAGGNENGEIVLWNLKNNERKVLAIDENRTIMAVAFSPDGKNLMTGNERGYVKIWEVSSGELITTLEGQRARIAEITYSHDGTKVAAASFDGSVQLWDLENLNDDPVTMKDHSSWVYTVAFSPDDQKLIAGCKDNIVRRWPTDSKSMADQMCGYIKRNMSQKEWQRYVAEDIDYLRTCNDLPSGEGIEENEN